MAASNKQLRSDRPGHHLVHSYDLNGTVYIADPTNNRIVAESASVGGTQTVIGPSITVSNMLYGQTTTASSTLSNPMGVAVDAAGNVYIADTGNSRVLKYNPVTGTANQLGNYLWIPGATCDTPGSQAANCTYTAYTLAGAGSSSSILNEPGASVTPTTAPPQYKFKNPQGLAVDQWGNVYVADTGNSVIVQIPSDTKLGGATQLFQYPGAPTFTTPVAVAIGPVIGSSGQNWPGYIFVADTGNPAGEIVRIPPGGGDLQPTTTTPGGGSTSALSVLTTLPLFGGQNINTPSGVAVDAAGNVYVSDGTGNAVWEAPAVNTSASFPAQLFWAECSGRSCSGREWKPVCCGLGEQASPANEPAEPDCSVWDRAGVHGNFRCGRYAGGLPGSRKRLTLHWRVDRLEHRQPACRSALDLPGGAYACQCRIQRNNHMHQPDSGGNHLHHLAEVHSSDHRLERCDCLREHGEYDSDDVLAGSRCEPGGPHHPGPLERYVNFWNDDELQHCCWRRGHYRDRSTVRHRRSHAHRYGHLLLDRSPHCRRNLLRSVRLADGQPGRWRSDDHYLPRAHCGPMGTPSAQPTTATRTNSTTTATPIVLKTTPVATVVTVTSTLAQLTYTYGGTVPTPACTVTAGGTAVAGATCTSGAGQFTATGSYPIQVVFTGASACSYGFPTVTTGQANVIENQAPLTVSFVVPGASPANEYTTVYGAATLNYATDMVITGAVGSDLKKLSATFTTLPVPVPPAPLDSSVLDVNPTGAVNPFPVVPTISGKPTNNYAITYNNGLDLVTPAPAGIAITAAKTSVANTTAGLASATYTIALSSLVTAGKGIPTGTISVYDYFVPITSTVFVPTPTSGTFQVINGAITWPTTATYGVQTVLIPPCATGQTSTASIPCNTVVTLSAGAGSFTLPATEATTTGTHYLSFVYSGDAGTNGDGKGDFACSVAGQLATTSPSCPTTNPIPFALIVDNPDFTLTSTTGPISVVPGNVPSGNGLPSAPNQSSANPQSAIISIGGVLSFTGSIGLTCTTQHPSWVFCTVEQFVVNANGQVLPATNVAVPCVAPACASTTSTVPFVFSVFTYATEPLGFNHVSTAVFRYQDRVGVPAVWRPRFLPAPPAQTEQGVVDADCHRCS